MTVAMRLLRNREDAEEAVQDAFVRAYRSLERFRGDSTFATWLYRILYNRCMTHATRRHPVDTGRSDTPDDGGGPESWASDEPSVLDRLADEEIRESVREELGALPTDQRAALTLFYVEGFRYEEIAVIMELPLGTVKTHLFRGRDRLRKRMMVRFSTTVNTK